MALKKKPAAKKPSKQSPELDEQQESEFEGDETESDQDLGEALEQDEPEAGGSIRAISVRASGPLHEREWFGRIYTKAPTILQVADLKPGELAKLKSDHFLTIEPV